MSAVLYSYRRCPYAIRARIIIKYCNFPVEIIEIDLKNKPQKLIEISPKATVPVLHLKNGVVIDQSRDIIQYVLKETRNEDLIPINQEQGEELIDENDNYFKIYLDKYKYPDRHPEDSSQNHRQKAEIFLEKLEKILNQNKFLFQNKISYIDICIFPFIRQFAFVDKDWFDNSEYKNLKIWLEFFLNSEIFLNVMKK